MANSQQFIHKMKLYSLLKSFIANHKARFTVILLIGFIVNLLTLLVPIAIGNFYDILLKTHTQKAKILTYLGLYQNNITGFILLFAILTSLKTVFIFLQKYQEGILTEFFSQKLRDSLFKRQMQQTMTSFHQKEIGKYLLRYSGDLTSLQNLLKQGILQTIVDILLVIMIFSAFASSNILLFFVLLLFIPLTILMLFFLNKRLNSVIQKQRNIKSANLSFIHQRLAAITTIKVFNKTEKETNIFLKKSNQLLIARKNLRFYEAIQQAIAPFLLYTALISIFITIIYTNTPHNHQKDIIIWIMLLLYALPALQRLIKVNSVWQSGIISFHKWQLLATQPIENLRKDQPIALKGTIELQNISFSYTPNKPIIKNFTAILEGNKITQIKGNSGKGKTTLFKLLLGLYPITGGTILINNQNISEISAFTLRKSIALVSKDTPLLGKTIEDAILYTKTEEKRVAALKMLHKLAFSIPNIAQKDLLKVKIATLSNGQKQQIKWARALLTRKPILLLDEPFDGLTNEIKQSYMAILQELKGKRTILIISHDPLFVPDNSYQL